MDKFEYRKQYYQNNKERIKAYARQYYKDNKERLKKKQKIYFKSWYRSNKYKINRIIINDEPIIKKVVDRILVTF